MADAVTEGLPLEAALSYHLQSNHYPPIPSGCVPVAVRVVNAVNNGEAWWEDEVDTNEVRHRTGRYLTVAELVEGWHLQPFLTQGEDQ
jgi:hypothetical protein